MKQSSHILNPMNQKSMIAWLEKQGKQKPTDGEMKAALQTEYEKGRADVIAEFKQGWTEKDTDTLVQLCRIIYRAKQDRLITQEEQNFLGTWIDKWLNHSPERKEQSKQNTIINKTPSKEMILAVWELGNIWEELTGGSSRTEYGTQLQYIQNHWSESLYYEKLNQKHADKITPKFKVGDWITNGACIIKITSVDDRYYWHDNNCVGGDIESVDKEYRIWTIQDAKDGDVLDFDCGVGIFKNLSADEYNAHCYCYYDTNSQLEINDCSLYDTYNAEPATKEQRDTLFAKIKEAGYEWNAEKKELKKIERKPASKFKIGDTIHKIGENTVFPMTIEKIEDGDYVCNDSHSFVNIKFQDDYELVEQKPADKVEPKFKVGDWIVKQYLSSPFVIVDIKNDSYILNDIEGNKYEETIDFAHKVFHPWTIQDAKDGDLIYVSTEIKGIQAIFQVRKNGIIYFHCNLCGDFTQGGYELSGDIKFVNPLPKIHYQRFFQKMKEAGYEWDAEKKELKKIEQKSVWSEEEEKTIDEAVEKLEKYAEYVQGGNSKRYILDLASRVESLRPQSKQEWSEKDERCFIELDTIIYQNSSSEDYNRLYNWLKSIKSNHWKPSKF